MGKDIGRGAKWPPWLITLIKRALVYFVVLMLFDPNYFKIVYISWQGFEEDLDEVRDRLWNFGRNFGEAVGDFFNPGAAKRNKNGVQKSEDNVSSLREQIMQMRYQHQSTQLTLREYEVKQREREIRMKEELNVSWLQEQMRHLHDQHQATQFWLSSWF